MAQAFSLVDLLARGFQDGFHAGRVSQNQALKLFIVLYREQRGNRLALDQPPSSGFHTRRNPNSAKSRVLTVAN